MQLQLKADQMTEEPADLETLFAKRLGCELYSSDDTAITHWLTGLDIYNKGKLGRLIKNPRKQKPTPKAITELLDDGGGLCLVLTPRQFKANLVVSVNVSQRRERGIRWISASFWGKPDAPPVERFAESSRFFEESVAVLQPVFGVLKFGNYQFRMYNNQVGAMPPGLLPIPFIEYGWRHYITPEFLEGRQLADGTLLDSPRTIDTGPLPFSILAERNRVQRLLEPLLPPRRTEPSWPFPAGSLELLQAAEIDGGMELPDNLLDWVNANTAGR